MNSRIVAALVSSTHSMNSLPSAFFTAAEMVAAWTSMHTGRDFLSTHCRFTPEFEVSNLPRTDHAGPVSNQVGEKTVENLQAEKKYRLRSRAADVGFSFRKNPSLIFRLPD